MNESNNRKRQKKTKTVSVNNDFNPPARFKANVNFPKTQKCGNVAEAEIISNTIDAQLYRMQEGSPGNTLSPRNCRTYTHDLF